MTVNVRDSKDAAGNANTTIDDSITVTINLTNVNEVPTITGGATNIASYAENQPNTTAISTYTASDVDASDTLTWSKEPADDGGKFEIGMSSGVLTFADSPDFEAPAQAGSTDNEYKVTVKVTDAGGLSATRTLIVNVTNVNEAPTIDSGPGSFSVDENTTTATVIATYEASDVDTSITLTWSKERNDAGDFVITKNADGEGELKFANVPNYEIPADAGTNNVYDVTVKVSDGSLTDTQSVVVTVEDVNETPVVSGDAGPSFAEIEFDVDDADLTAPDYVIGTYAASDEENDDIEWSVSGTDMAHFAIGPTTGILSFNIRPDFENAVDMGSNNTYEIVVEALDNNSQGVRRGSRRGRTTSP